MFDLPMLVETAGYLGLFAIVFAESGLFIGFFLPGDSLLFTAGLLASAGYFDIGTLVAVFISAAVLGDNFGYYFGSRLAEWLLARPDSLLFKRKRFNQARDFFESYGPRALVLGRFMPGIRTFVPILAGMSHMLYSRFFLYNLSGGAIWVVFSTGLGYLLGSTVPDAERYLLPVILVIVVVSFLPALRDVAKYYRAR